MRRVEPGTRCLRMHTFCILRSMDNLCMHRECVQAIVILFTIHMKSAATEALVQISRGLLQLASRSSKVLSVGLWDQNNAVCMWCPVPSAVSTQQTTKYSVYLCKTRDTSCRWYCPAEELQFMPPAEKLQFMPALGGITGPSQWPQYHNWQMTLATELSTGYDTCVQNEPCLLLQLQPTVIMAAFCGLGTRLIARLGQRNLVPPSTWQWFPTW